MPQKAMVHRGGTFEVLHGVHDEEGTMYEAGEAVTSDKDLDKMFAEKFKRIGGKNMMPRDFSDHPNESGTRSMDRPLHARVGKKKEKPPEPTAKKYVSPSKKFFDEEDVEEEDKKKTRKRVGHTTPDEEAEEAPTDDEETEGMDEESGGEEADEDESEETELGKDMSAQFEQARKADLKVFKGEKGYHIVDADEPDKPLNRTPLATKGAVETFVEEYRTGDTGRKAAAEKKSKAAKKKSKK